MPSRCVHAWFHSSGFHAHWKLLGIPAGGTSWPSPPNHHHFQWPTCGHSGRSTWQWAAGWAAGRFYQRTSTLPDTAAPGRQAAPEWTTPTGRSPGIRTCWLHSARTGRFQRAESQTCKLPWPAWGKPCSPTRSAPLLPRRRAARGARPWWASGPVLQKTTSARNGNVSVINVFAAGRRCRQRPLGFALQRDWSTRKNASRVPRSGPITVREQTDGIWCHPSTLFNR